MHSLKPSGLRCDSLPGRKRFNVYSNMKFDGANRKSNIYGQAVLEGVVTSFPQTEGGEESLECLLFMMRKLCGSKHKVYHKKCDLFHLVDFVPEKKI